MTGQTEHLQKVVNAIMVGRVYRDKQFVYREYDGRWASIPVTTRDVIRRTLPEWPR